MWPSWSLAQKDLYDQLIKLADERHWFQSSFPTSEDKFHPKSLNWNYQAGADGSEHVGNVTYCLNQGLKNFSYKQVNYQKLRKQTQRTDENPALFLSRLTEAPINLLM